MKRKVSFFIFFFLFSYLSHICLSIYIYFFKYIFYQDDEATWEQREARRGDGNPVHRGQPGCRPAQPQQQQPRPSHGELQGQPSFLHLSVCLFVYVTCPFWILYKYSYFYLSILISIFSSIYLFLYTCICIHPSGGCRRDPKAGGGRQVLYAEPFLRHGPAQPHQQRREVYWPCLQVGFIYLFIFLSIYQYMCMFMNKYK